jgi:hypothetical protein
METSRTFGSVLMGLSALQMLLFMIGVMRRSYAAIALPMTLAMAGISALLFWVGYTMANMDTDIADLDMEEEEEVPFQDAATA